MIELGTYDPDFTATWRAIQAEQRAFVGAAGWWSRGGPGGRVTTPARVVAVLVAVLVALAVVVVGVIALGTDFWLAFSSPWLALIAGFLVPLVVAAGAYSVMFPSRTATASALVPALKEAAVATGVALLLAIPLFAYRSSTRDDSWSSVLATVPRARLANVEVPIPYAKHLETAAIPQVDGIVAAARSLLGAR